MLATFIAILFAGCFLIAWRHAQRVTRQKVCAALAVREYNEIMSEMSQYQRVPQDINERLARIAQLCKDMNR